MSSADNAATLRNFDDMPQPPSSERSQMLVRGIACIAIGAAVLLAPAFLQSPGLRATVAGAHVVGWFAVALGVALVVVDLVQRARRR